MTTLTSLAAYCWQEIASYQKILLAGEDDVQYEGFCRGVIRAHERLLEKLEEIEAQSQVSLAPSRATK